MSTFLLLIASLLACSEKQAPTSGAKQYAAKAAKKVDQLTHSLFVPEGDQKMLVTLGGFTFKLPDSWRDTSSYIYKSKKQEIALTVSFGKIRETITLEKLVAQRRQELSNIMGDEVEFVLQLPSKIANLTAISQSFSFGDQNNKYMEYWATAYYTGNKYLSVSYVGPHENKTLRATFEHILSTSQPISGPQPEQSTVHYVWRQAHILRLQIPNFLQAPKHYSYESLNGSLKLKASFYKPSASLPDSGIKEHAVKDLHFGGRLGAFSIKHINNLTIQQIDYVFQGGDPLEPSLYRAHRAQVDGFGGNVTFFIKGHKSQTSQIDALWLQFMTDLIENSSPQEALDAP